jgi:hypothetical protein
MEHIDKQNKKSLTDENIVLTAYASDELVTIHFKNEVGLKLF